MKKDRPNNELVRTPYEVDILKQFHSDKVNLIPSSPIFQFLSLSIAATISIMAEVLSDFR